MVRIPTEKDDYFVINNPIFIRPYGILFKEYKWKKKKLLKFNKNLELTNNNIYLCIN